MHIRANRITAVIGKERVGWGKFNNKNCIKNKFFKRKILLEKKKNILKQVPYYETKKRQC